jgi:hypothetical protein
MRIVPLVTTILGASILLTAFTHAAAPASRGARINNLKVLSDKIDDVTTAENIVKSFAKPGMSDAERAKALWTASVKYRHQTVPPNEQLAADWEAHDPVKLFNVYGYCMCCCASSLIESLNRLDGREARGRILTGHSVPEVRYGGAWHMFDASLLTLFPKPGSGDLASVDEISAAVRGWLDQHPEYRGNDRKLREMMASEEKMGWKLHGPELLANCPYYRQGWFPAKTHGWYSTMQEYDRQSEFYEYGYQLGHRALFALRPGESLVREAGNHGLHVNQDRDPGWNVLHQRQAPLGDLAYLSQFYPGYNGGVVANGFHRYAPDLTAGGLAAGADLYENLAEGGTPALHPRVAGTPGVAVVELSSPYVYLGGRLKLRALRRSAADRVAVSLSTNNGRTFTPLWSAETTGAQEATVELGSRILRRYAYWLKIEIAAETPGSAGLESFAVENDIQHAPRTLPWLGKGANTITVAADGDTALASRAFTGRITPEAGFIANETALSLGVTFENLDVQGNGAWWKSGVGSMTVPIETPGAITTLRFGAQVRARGERDAVRMLLSFDGGKNWQEAGKISGPTAGTTRYFRFDAVPADTKQALLRYELTGDNTIGVMSFRADADYRDPLAAASFHPFDVVHRWKENGIEKSKRVTVSKLPFTYQIDAAAEPEMVAVSYEMAAR